MATPDEVGASEAFSELAVDLRVIRCGCGHPVTHKGQPCPSPREIVDIDTEHVIVVQTEEK